MTNALRTSARALLAASLAMGCGGSSDGPVGVDGADAASSADGTLADGSGGADADAPEAGDVRSDAASDSATLDTVADSTPPDTKDSGGDTVASDTKDSGPDVAVGTSKACIDCMNVSCSDLQARCVAFKSCPFLDCALACKTAACISECDKKNVGGDTQAEAVTCMTGTCAAKCTSP